MDDEFVDDGAMQDEEGEAYVAEDDPSSSSSDSSDSSGDEGEMDEDGDPGKDRPRKKKSKGADGAANAPDQPGTPTRLKQNLPGKSAEAGIITQVYVENFMCHRKVREWKDGRKWGSRGSSVVSERWCS